MSGEDIAPAHVRECPTWITELLSLAAEKLSRPTLAGTKNKFATKKGDFVLQVPIEVQGLEFSVIGSRTQPPMSSRLASRVGKTDDEGPRALLFGGTVACFEPG